MSTSEDEEIARKNSQIRRSGNVDVVTIPAELANLNAVKREHGKLHPILVIRRAGKYLIEIHLEENPLES